MAFHVACPITCKRICFCTLGFPPRLQDSPGRTSFFHDVSLIEQFLKDPWIIRVKEGTAVQVPVPPLPPPPVTVPVLVADDDAVTAEELLSAQTKRAALQKKAAVASMVAEDFARRFECGSLEDASKDNTIDEQGQTNVNVMCRLCFSGENEGSERARRMLPCRTCGKKYHRSCLKVWSQHRDLFHWSSWTCPSCLICEVCRRTGEPNKFKFCKRCDGAIHCYCMQPPHKNVSSGPYLCPKHTKCHSCGSNVPGNGLSLRWFLGYTCCDACGRLFTKGNYCPVCLKVYRDSEATPMVCCDICQRWVHCECDGISDERYLQFQTDGNLPYTCPTCRGECYQVRDLEDAVQELWRRRDEADCDLIASLRAAAGLPTQDEIFSISPFSDDEDDGPSAVKSDHGRGKFSLKNLAEFPPKKTIESTPKKSSSKKYVKKKGFPDMKMEANIEDRHGHDIPSEAFPSSITGSLSPTVRICSTNEQGFLKDQLMDEVTNNKVSGKRTVVQFKRKINDNPTSVDVGKVSSKPKPMKGTKLVIHLGGRNKTITNSPRSDSSSYQREQELLTQSGSEAASQRRTVGDSAKDTFDGTSTSDNGYRGGSPREVIGLKPKERNIIKLGKSKSQAPVINLKSDRGNGLSSTPEIPRTFSLKRSRVPNAPSLGFQSNVSKSEKVPSRKYSVGGADILSADGNKSNKQAPPPLLDSLIKDSRPLLRLKLKTPFLNSWPMHGEEERGSVKGQRSKRKRPSPLVEKSKNLEQKDGLQSQEENLTNEMIDANWVLKKLGRDAIGKRVEVHQPSDNSWHKGIVDDVIEGTSMLSIGLDDGRTRSFELGKEGIRFVPQTDKKLRS